MLKSRVIPCLDVREGRIVKGVQFARLRDAGNPVERAALYAEQGADEIIMLDISATPEGRSTSVETVKAIRQAVGIPLAVGGGVHAVDDAASLLNAGADKVCVNTAALREPALLEALADRFGSQCIVLAIDAKRTPRKDGLTHAWGVVVRSGTEAVKIDAASWAMEGVRRGAGEILLTSIDRDGTAEGYDLDLIRAVRASIDVPVIASGGASTPDDLVEAIRAGADAVLAASIFHDGVYSVREVKFLLMAKGVEVRM
ncbi:MAG: imidazole glycerol phosphate synthase subunit HisF [Phycisphaeraceae bacterium]|nr:imidazole glycerol phosphate synthase subunit HisF [Phycisphaeraceae bacterium]